MQRPAQRSSRPAEFRSAGSAAGSRPRSVRASSRGAPLPRDRRRGDRRTSSPDAIVTQGVVRRRRRPPARGPHRRGRDDRRARPGLRRGEQAGRARRHGAAAARSPASPHVRPDLRAGRARLQRQQLAPRRVRDRDRLRHGARATYWFLNYHTPDEFGLAADYIANVLRPDIVVHSNSFLFGPFDGSGWFARKVDARRRGGRPLGQLGGQLPQPPLGGRVERRGRRRQPRRDRRRQRVRVPARGDEPPGLRPLLGGRDRRPGQLLPHRALHGRRADAARAAQDHRAADPVQRPRPRCPSPTPTCRRAPSPRRGRTTSASSASARRRRRD